MEFTIPDHITFEETVAVGLEEAGITEIGQPEMKIYLRPRVLGEMASVTIGIYCDLMNGGQGKDPSYYMYSLTILKFDNRDTQLSNEWKKMLTIPCVISSFTNTLDGEDLHWVSRLPSWARGAENLHLPNWVSEKTWQHLHSKVMSATRAQRQTGRLSNLDEEMNNVFPYSFTPRELRRVNGRLGLQDSPHGLERPKSLKGSLKGRHPSPEDSWDHYQQDRGYQDYQYYRGGYGSRYDRPPHPYAGSRRNSYNRSDGDGTYHQRPQQNFQEKPLHTRVPQNEHEDNGVTIKPTTDLKSKGEEQRPEVENPKQEKNPVETPKEEGEESTKDKRKVNSTPGAEKVAQKGTQTVKANRRRQPSTDSYLSHWSNGIPIVKQEGAKHQFQFGQDMSGDNAPITNPPVQPEVQKDLLTGEPIIQTLSSTPLQPTSAGTSEGPTIPQMPPNVGSFIDEIRAMEADRNARIDELMARDEDFESQIGFDDKYKLMPSSSGDEHTSEEDAEENEISTTITELLQEKAKYQNGKATSTPRVDTVQEKEKSQDEIATSTPKLNTVQEKEKSHDGVAPSTPVQEKEKSQNESARSAPKLDTVQQEVVPPHQEVSTSPSQPTHTQAAYTSPSQPTHTQAAYTSARQRLGQPIEKVLANTPLRGKLVVLGDAEDTTEADEGLTSGYEADLPSECDEMVNKITNILDQYNLDTESRILQKQLEQKEEVLLQQIRYQLEEINRLSSSFYNSLLENTEIKFAMVSPKSLAKDAGDRLYKLMEIEEKLRNSKNEIKKDSTVRKSARQAMMTKRSFKDY